MNPAVLKFVVVIAAICALIAVVFGVYKHIDAVGYERGVSEERVKWQDRANKELAAANAEITRLNALYRGLEKKSADDSARIATKYEQEVKDANANLERYVADVRDGRIVLRDPGAATAQAGGGAAPAAGSPAGGGDGRPGAGLSAAASEFLLRLTGEADTVVRQLQACQQVVASDREVCK